VTEIVFAFSTLKGTIYAPVSPPPPATYVAGMKELKAIFFPPAEEIGFIQLRHA
jgi:hypothetical protein